jgi:hypothetical protein
VREPQRGHAPAGILALLESRAPGYWVAEIDGRVVGQLIITFEWSDWRRGHVFRGNNFPLCVDS